MQSQPIEQGIGVAGRRRGPAGNNSKAVRGALLLTQKDLGRLETLACEQPLCRCICKTSNLKSTGRMEIASSQAALCQSDRACEPAQVRTPAKGAPPLSCPFPTREAAQKVAVRNTIMHALINRDFLDFFMNWHKHLQKLKVSEGSGLMNFCSIRMRRSASSPH